MADLTRLYQSETKKYYLKVKDPDTDTYIDPTASDSDITDIEVIVYTKQKGATIKRMNLLGGDDWSIMSTGTDTSGNTYLIIPLEYSIVKEIQPGQLAIQITIVKVDTDFDDDTSRKSYTADLNPVKTAVVK